MLDFPASPTIGQTFQSAAGSTWQWDGVKWTPLTASAPGSTANVGRNLIHNPTFTVAQRGAGPFTVNGYTLDRWSMGPTIDTSSVTQTAFADAQRTQVGDEAAVYSLNNTFTGSSNAGAYTSLQQPIESVRRLAGKNVMVSFWAGCGSGTLKLGINLTQLFGTGGSPSAANRILTTGLSVTLSTTWTRYTVGPIAVPSVAGKTLGTNNNDFTQLEFWYSSGANLNAAAGNVGVQSGTIGIWGVQLEVGSVATPLDYGGTPADQLRQCQRYYQTGKLITTGWCGGAGQGIYFSSLLPVTLRATPTFALTDTSGSGNCTYQSMGTYNATNGLPMAVWIYATAATAGQSYTTAIGFTASADL